MYEVHLGVFDGPLDLLLRLVERRELEITAVSLVAVAEQYLSHLHAAEQLDADALADFLVVAARLLLLKSRQILPQPPAQSQETAEPDGGESLVQLLRDYRQYQQVAAWLRQREEAGRRIYPRPLGPLPPEPALRPGDGRPADLRRALLRLQWTRQASPEPEPVERRQVTIEERLAHLEAALAAGPVSFRRLLAGANRLEAIVTFLALLELLRRDAVDVQQPALFEDIAVQRRLVGT